MFFVVLACMCFKHFLIHISLANESKWDWKINILKMTLINFDISALRDKTGNIFVIVLLEKALLLISLYLCFLVVQQDAMTHTHEKNLHCYKQRDFINAKNVLICAQQSHCYAP